MCIGTGHFDAVNQTAVLIYADVGLISEMPCIALLYLMRIRIPFFPLVFGGRKGLYDGGIRSFRWSIFTTCRILFTFLWISSLGSLRLRKPKATLSNTFMWGNTA